MTVALRHFEAIGPGLPQGVSAILDAEMRTALSDKNVPVTTQNADLLLTGSIRRIEGDQIRFTAKVDEPSSGTMLWARTLDRPIADDNSAGQFALTTAQAIECAVSAAHQHPGDLPASALALALQSCAERSASDFGKQLVISRRLVREQPDFWLGWAHIAYAVVGTEMMTGRVNAVLADEARAAAQRVIALRPEEATGYAILAQVTSPHRAMERESLLRRATAILGSRRGYGPEYLGDFLMQVGRVAEASDLYRRGLDQDVNLISIWRAAAGDYLSNRVAAGDSGMRQLRALAGERPSNLPRILRMHAAVWNGRWAEAATLLDTPVAEEQAALREGLTALAAGEPERIGRARAAVEELRTSVETETLVIPILAALGGTDSVLERLEASRRTGGYYAAPGRRPGLSRPLLFDPLLKPIWFDRRFPAFLERAGFIRYWRESRSRPDICRAPGPPSFCGML